MKKTDKESYRRGFEDAIELVLEILNKGEIKKIPALARKIRQLKVERLKRELELS